MLAIFLRSCSCNLLILLLQTPIFLSNIDFEVMWNQQPVVLSQMNQMHMSFKVFHASGKFVKHHVSLMIVPSCWVRHPSCKKLHHVLLALYSWFLRTGMSFEIRICKFPTVIVVNWDYLHTKITNTVLSLSCVFTISWNCSWISDNVLGVMLALFLRSCSCNHLILLQSCFCNHQIFCLPLTLM